MSLTLAACVAKDPENLGELETSTSSASTTDPSTTSTSTTGISATTVESATTDESTTAQSTTAEPTTEGGTTFAETESESATGESTGETIQCEGDEEVLHFPAGCPEAMSGVQLAVEGCYEECSGLEDPCLVGSCVLMQVDPCPCANDPDACCDACSGQQWLCVDDTALGECGLVVGRTFSSVEELECGLGPKGPELCNWTVAFALDGTFMWMHSDVGEGGAYGCADGEITISDGPQVEVDYDADAGILTWDGVQYQ